MRLFTCTYLSDDNQAFYDQHVARLVETSRGLLRPIPQMSAHLTYAFLPKLSETDYERIVAALDAVDHPTPIPIRLGHPIVVYARKQPRLVCADVLSGEAELRTLARSVIEAVNRACPPAKVGAAKSPHVTLARFRRDAVREYGHTVENLLVGSELALERHDTISEIYVVDCKLTPAGPIYTVKHRRSFRDRTK